MKKTSIVIDNFLPKPDLVREQAINLDYPTTGSFPGMRSLACDDDYQLFIYHRFQEILGVNIKEFTMDSFCFQLCYEGAETWIHKDGTDYAGVLYLNPDAPSEAGTGLYLEKDGEYDLVNVIGNVYNRLVIYDGNMDHASLIAGFGNSPDTGRLTQVFFFNTEERAWK